MTMADAFTRQSTCVAIKDRAVLIEGASGMGKSSLALALIDRGAQLIGDDGVLLRNCHGRLHAQPHPNTRGLLEVRNLGILPFPCREEAQVALVVTLDDGAPRFIEAADSLVIGGVSLPALRLWPHAGPLVLKVELALLHYGLT